MKKFLVLALTALLISTAAGLSVSALAFSDLAEAHWAYNDIQTLVTDGTVSGYEDGSFRPGGTVTRAEFVKMLGAGPVRRAQEYSDVLPEHWAYEYIMNAGFPENDTNLFIPNQPITRGLVAELLWNRGGNATDAFAPAIITSQYARKPQAAAWVYATGLMHGDDGVNLRLDDTLSRAEAAVLIIRSRSVGSNRKLFADSVSPEILKNVYDGLNLFDGKPYIPEDTITNGAMARAVLRIGSEETNLSYVGQTARANFEHPYARDLAIICNNCLGTAKLTTSFADQKANFGNTVAALVHQFITKAKTGMEYGAETDGLPEGISSMANICLTFAKNNGIISLKEDLAAPITVRDFTAICLLLDNMIGSQSDITSDVNTITGSLIKADHSLLLTEVPYGDFRVMMKDMPGTVYTKAPIVQASTPVESYNFAREYASIFTGILQHLKASVKERSGVDVRLTYYPSLVWDNGNGYTMRIACDILEMSGTKSFNQLFVTRDGMEDADTLLQKGARVYFDLATGEPIKSVRMTDEKAYAEQIVITSQQ